tara:strand:+ start:158 stop:595 length:438 start_codon:yes stop_codon:yes gene_type:complete
MSIKYINTSNLTYELHDKSVNITPNNETPNIHDILDNDDYFSDEDIDGFQLPSSNINYFGEILDDDISAQHVDYSENYTVKMLSHIANYYDIPKKKIKKDELISLIVDYENNPENSIQVYNRKRCWHYIQELQEDSYFGKFIVFN